MNRDARAVELLWRSAVVVALAAQLGTAALSTAWGARNVAPLMVRLGIFQSRQVGPILDLMRPPGADAALALETEIAKSVPKNRPVVFIWAGKPSNGLPARLSYGLYPRNPNLPGEQCTVFWRSDSDVTLSCPGFLWRFAKGGPSPQ